MCFHSVKHSGNNVFSLCFFGCILSLMCSDPGRLKSDAIKTCSYSKCSSFPSEVPQVLSVWGSSGKQITFWQLLCKKQEIAESQCQTFIWFLGLCSWQLLTRFVGWRVHSLCNIESPFFIQHFEMYCKQAVVKTNAYILIEYNHIYCFRTSMNNTLF